MVIYGKEIKSSTDDWKCMTCGLWFPKRIAHGHAIAPKWIKPTKFVRPANLPRGAYTKDLQHVTAKYAKNSSYNATRDKGRFKK